MFSIKYRTYVPAGQGNDGSYFVNEQLHGPYDFVSQEWVEQGKVVHAHKGDGLPMTFGPVISGSPNIPNPELWVMNAAGATVAHYAL